VTVAQRAVRSAFYNAAAGYGTQVLGLVATAVLGRLLGPGPFGVFGLALTIVLFFARVRLWGFNQVLISMEAPDDEAISTQFWLSIAFSTLMAGLVIAALPLLNLLYDRDVLLLAVIVGVLSIFEAEGVASTPENLLIRDLRFSRIAASRLISTALGHAAAIGVALLGGLRWALVVGFAVTTLSYCAGVWITAPRRPRFLFSQEKARLFLKQGSFLWWGGIGTYLAYQYDDIAVGTLAGTVQLGLYRKAYDLSLVPMSLIGGVMSVTLPTYAQVRDERAALSRAVSFVLDAIALITLPSALGLALLAREAILILLGTAWLGAIPILQILVIYALFRPLNDSVGGLAMALGKPKVQMWYGVMQSVAMLTVCTVLTLLWGANGAAISAGVVVIAGFALFYATLLRPHVDVDYAGIFGVPVLGMILAGAALVGAGALLPESTKPLPAFLLKGLAFGLVYLGVLWLLRRQDLIEKARFFYRQLFPGRDSQPASTLSTDTHRSQS